MCIYKREMTQALMILLVKSRFDLFGIKSIAFTSQRSEITKSIDLDVETHQNVLLLLHHFGADYNFGYSLLHRK